ncbi:MAG: low molecular weight protein arginine phosphatase [Deltaproteobacteria bacterium]|nr:low molecular weight protein arginine phosphatase [Deltaproteobacteria bacterium]
MSMNILFVCTGNICRSPTAEGILRKLIAERQTEKIEAASAGLYALPGNSVSRLALQVAQEHGVDLSQHSAQLVSSQLIAWADFVLVMEPAHREGLIACYPEAKKKIFMIRHFADSGSSPRSIADPYGLQYESYRFCYLDLEDAVKGLLYYLRSVRYETIQVSCYGGYKADEYPKSFVREGRAFIVNEIIDRWYEGGIESTSDIIDYFKVRTDDGNVYIIRHNRLFDGWAIRRT